MRASAAAGEPGRVCLIGKRRQVRAKDIRAPTGRRANGGDRRWLNQTARRARFPARNDRCLVDCSHIPLADYDDERRFSHP